MPGRRTSKKRVGKLVKNLDRYIEKVTKDVDKDNLEDFLETTGRFMHHIQDNSTPTHTVPIYHGPGLIDQFEVYAEAYVGQLELTDSQAEADPNNGDRLKAFISDEEISRAFDAVLTQPREVHSLMNLYENSALATLKYIKENTCSGFQDGKEKEFPLIEFWLENNDQGTNQRCTEKQKMKKISEGFGSFGLLCNNFGALYFSVGNSHIRKNLGSEINIS